MPEQRVSFQTLFAASRAYRFELSERCEKELRKLDPTTRARIGVDVGNIEREWHDESLDLPALQGRWQLKTVKVDKRYAYLQVAQCYVNRSQYRIWLVICPHKDLVVVLGAWK